MRRGPCHELPSEEVACDKAAARGPINIRALGEALAWANTPEEAADELWVDKRMLDVRIAHLHPSERAYLQRRLESSDGTG